MTTQSTSVWAIDPAHSEISFKVKHLVVTTLTGKFNSFSGSLHTDEADFSNASISFKADISSINTGNADRDNHLKSDDFFNAEAFPTLSFNSTSFTKTGDHTYRLIGDITLRDVTQSIELAVEFGGTAVDPWGQTKAGFEINGKLKRKDFGLKWDALTEAGGAVVSDEVKLHLNVQLVKQ
ncbi:MAG: YceI family protein [Bacteroidia bacterium]|jgi:polyisoprenoid-binding protein YceI|nr:YceI family protein [Bacteroidia bacterium]